MPEVASLTLNPLSFAQQVNAQYLRYQLTQHRLTDPALGDQLRDLLWNRSSPLVKGPYVSVSRAFEEGRAVRDLISEKLLHPKMETVIPYDTVFKHQEETLRAIVAGRDVLITTGTGSGKTESFLYPILNRVLRARDNNAPPGVMALIIYPMNALATDQLERLRELLVGTGITFGMYTGETPNERADASYTIQEAPAGLSRERYKDLLRQDKGKENQVLHPHEERFTRQMIQEDPPRILLTNTRMLEYLMTRPDDLVFLRGAPIEFLVMDEAHTNSGALGAEVALLVRRVKSLAAARANIRHIAASATIADKANRKEGQRFMHRLLGAPEENVHVVHESYADIGWHEQPLRAQYPRAALPLFERTLKALGAPDPNVRADELEAIYGELTNHELPPGAETSARLHDGFLRIDFARAIYETGVDVGEINERVESAWRRAGRGPVRDTESARWEYLTYLALGAAAQKDGTSIIRPKLHYFVKGLEDAVVVFQSRQAGQRHLPKLYLSPEDAMKAHPDLQPTAMFPVNSCPRCGQHHYVAYLDLEDVEEKGELTGGTQVDGGAAFHPDPTATKARVHFTDRILQESGEYDGDEATKKHIPGRVCRFCGALHSGEPKRCGSCEHPQNHDLVPVHILNSLDKVTSCPVCGYGAGWGAGKREDPFRALVENTARNVYVLAQDMLALAEPESRKLIVFADNRQDAAFQAGSMRDNARLFRLRRLIHTYLYAPERLEADRNLDPSVESLVDRLVADLTENDALGRFVAPEVYEAAAGGSVSGKRAKELRRFISLQVLQELARPYTDRKALEGLGCLRVTYAGLHPDNEHLQDLANRHNLAPKEVHGWLETICHMARRRTFLTHDLVPELFTRSWKDKRNDLVQSKYLPSKDYYPGGLLLSWDRPEVKRWGQVMAFIGRNSAVETWAKAGLGLVEPDARQAFLRDAWSFLTKRTEALRCIPHLKWSDGKPIPGTDNVYHIDGAAMILRRSHERWECRLCKRLHSHPTPNDSCTGYRCTGKLEPVDDQKEPRDYDLVLLELERDLDSFVMAAEHTAQVPKDRRQEIERKFKKGGSVNTLVATPTLELGVDIGPLDMVLMRNVPPTTTNYWQRAGRAGRRNRMAVVYTYVRNNAHDIHYYQRPTEILRGSIKPPRFNLRNPVMLRKHVHAALLTWFQTEIKTSEANWTPRVFPKRVGDILFQDGRLKQAIEDIVKPFQDEIDHEANRRRIVKYLEGIFQADWPDEPAAVTTDVLSQMVKDAPARLHATYRRVWNRLQWAQRQIMAIAAREQQDGMVSDEDDRFRKRCRSLLNAYNPTHWSKDQDKKRSADTYTLKVLAVEGYLPGYATTQDAVTASAHQAYLPGWERFEFELSRNTTVAIREHIPGNRIYANGGKYQVTNYLFPADPDAQSPATWKIHPESGAIRSQAEIQSTENMEGWTDVTSVPLVDSSLQYISHIDAEETTRFRLASQIAGIVGEDHDGGLRYETNEGDTFDHRRGQRITLVNLGPVSKQEDLPGFPICTNCGAVRSPFDTDDAIGHFERYHEKLHKQKPGRYALHVRATVDGLSFPVLEDAATAASLGEALTLAASQLLDMERDDLHWFTQQSSDGQHALFLYDPMPGGSGLLHQLLDRWDELTKTAHAFLKGCPGACATACYHCLKTYYNQFWHEHLDRAKALAAFDRFADLKPPTTLEMSRHGIDVLDTPTNKWERMLEETVTKEWGYSGFKQQGRIELGKAASIPYTLPDLIHEKAKIAIYLDGGPHFSAAALQKDQTIEFLLEGKRWLVVRVPIGDFQNKKIMERHRQRIEARILDEGPAP